MMGWYVTANYDDAPWLPAGDMRDEAIAQGRRDFGDALFIIAQGRDLMPENVFPSAKRLLEDVQEYVQDEYGQEDWPELSLKDGAAFEAEYLALIRKYFPERCPFAELHGYEEIPARTSPQVSDSQTAKGPQR